MVLGIDEVGRGCWAGPLVVGAVVLGGASIEGLTDSKKLSKKRRESLEPEIYTKASGVGLGWVSALELDEIGMSAALRLATRRAVEQVKAPYHEIIIDGTINFLTGTTKERFVTTLPKGDLLVPSISAASIVAKVARDRYMYEQDVEYPGYGFKSHVGYGVALHRKAIDDLGVTPLHRLSFLPLQKYQRIAPDDETVELHKPTSRSIGDMSETEAANYLTRLGHTVIERNWKTRWCEIDIISERRGTVYFTEVKHRRNDKGGDGFAAITPRKLRQMKFAAELYLMNKPATDVRLFAIATEGDQPLVTECLDAS